MVLVGCRENSPTFDEYMHVPVGLAYWESHAFHLYPHNPPLSRWIVGGIAKVAGAKGGAVGYSFGDRGADFRIARAFHARNRDRIRSVYFACRSVNLVFGLLAACLLFRLVRASTNGAVAAVFTSLFLLDPTVVGHSAVATPDVLVMFLILAMQVSLLSFLHKPSWSRALVLGCVGGLAIGTKFSAIPIAALTGLTLLVRVFRRSASGTISDFGLSCAGLLFVLNGLYLFAGFSVPLGDFAFRSRALCPQGHGVGNVFEGTAVGGVAVPLPADFIMGLDAQQYDFDRRGFEKYLAGERRSADARGWWYYYLVCWLLKSHVGAIALVAVGIGAMPVTTSRPLEWCRLLTVCSGPIALGVALSLHSTINSHFRYALPCLPFVYFAAGSVFPWGRVWRAVGFALVLLACLELACARGAELSYFNFVAGGPAKGHAWLSDSNVDWGQAMPAVSEWIIENADGQPVWLAHVSPVALEDYGVEAELEHSSTVRLPGYHIVSASLLTGVSYSATLTDGAHVSYGSDSFSHFRRMKSLCVIRGAMHVYFIPKSDPVHRTKHYSEVDQ